ncbi:MAG: chromate transporter [Candidatus Cloacimonetes bacterium]|nr:chromate transporter [Candidatus Cloacimonadota bacterium]
MSIYLQLFTTFFRIGAFTIGGGYAMLPLIQHEVVDKKGWLSEDDFLNCTALSQSSPGPIAVNIAVLTGYRTSGVRGSVCSTVGAVLPAIVIMIGVAALFSVIYGQKALDHIFAGIRPVVTALIASAVIKMGKNFRIRGYIVGGIAMMLVVILKVSPIYVILGSIATGVSLHFIRSGK